LFLIESSVPGLYFVGAAAKSFGPAQRFAVGARFAARQVSRSLAGKQSRTGLNSDFEHRLH
jgi:hypothetical protein